MTTSRSDALVLFGVTGDLAHKMTFPALYAMAKRGVLKVPVVGVAFPKWSLARLRNRVTDSIRRSGGIDDKRAFRHLLSQFSYKPSHKCLRRMMAQASWTIPRKFSG
jgi:glucose-6-phosphate 1-dehydrogenase